MASVGEDREYDFGSLVLRCMCSVMHCISEADLRVCIAPPVYTLRGLSQRMLGCCMY